MKKELQDKILAATDGTKTGAILRCAMGRNVAGVVPKFVGKATVTSDGYVMCSFIDSDENGHHGAFVGSRVELVANLKALARHLNLIADEELEVQYAVDAWMGIEIIDMRTKPRALPGALGPEGE